MAMTNRLRKVLQRWWGGAQHVVGFLFSGVTRKSLSIDDTLKVGVVWACVQLKALTWSSLVVREMKRERHTDGRVIHREVLNPAPWLEDPEGTGDSTWPGFVSMVSMSLDLFGNVFAEVIATPSRVLSITILDPNLVDVDMDYTTGQYQWRVELRDGNTVYAPRWVRGMTWGVLHIPGLQKPGEILGIAPLQSASEAIGVAKIAERYAGRFFANSARPDVVIQYPPGIDIDSTMLDRIAAGFEDRHEGSDRSHKVGVLTQGAKLETLSIPPDQAQFLETRIHQAEDICRIFGVPQHAVGLLSKSTSWGTGIEEQSIGFTRFTMAGIIRRFEAVMSRLMARGRSLVTDLTGLERASLGTRVDAFSKLRQMGAMSANDVRIELGWTPVDDPALDDYTNPMVNPAPDPGVEDPPEDPPEADEE